MNIGTILHYTVYVAEVLALVCAMIYIKKYIHRPARLLPVYLTIVVLVETLGFIVYSNQWMYNLLGVAELVIISLVLYRSVESKFARSVIGGSFILSVVLLFVDAVFVTKGVNDFWSTSFSFVSVGTTFMCFAFLFELARSEKVMYLNRLLLYWVVIGLLIFHLCNLPVTLFTHELISIGNVETFLIIQSIAATAMYCCYIIGFVWSKKEWN